MGGTQARAFKRGFSVLLSSTLIAGTLSVGSIGTNAISPAIAAPALDCTAVYSVQGATTNNGANPRNLWQVNTATGVQTSVATFDIAQTAGSLNGLGLAADGSSAIGVLPNSSGTGRTIYELDRASETTTPLGAGANSAPVTHGAVNPATGFYYYGGVSSGSVQIYGFDTTTNTSLGLVASGPIPNAGGSGDWAFDRQGRLYVVAGASDNVLSVIDQQLPTTAGSAITVTASELVSIATPSAVNGIAFGGDGYLYLGTGAQVLQVDPVTGAVVTTLPFSQAGSVDLASCATPNTITVQKDFPTGRVATGDQATVSVTGGGLPAGIEGTTEGADTGVQTGAAEVAGPVFGRIGETYTISETGTGTVASSATSFGYASSWSCVDQNSGDSIASGEGTEGTFTIPADASGIAVLCTFTNTAEITALTLNKVASTPSGNTAGSTVSYTFDVTNTGTVPLETVTVTDPLVGTVTCPNGPLAVGATTTCTAEPYVLTQEDVNAGEVVNNASATGTVEGLPNATGSDTETTEIEQVPSLQLVKEAGTAVDVNNSGITDAGDTIQYSFTVTNNGNLPISGIVVTDELLSGLDPEITVTCEETALQPAALTNCVANAPYTITAADEADGEVVNLATATGTASNLTAVTSNVGRTSTEVTAQLNNLVLIKNAGDPVDVNASGITDAGDTIQYTFTVTNNGNVPVTGLAIDDAFLSDLDPAITITCAASTLAVGDSTICTADSVYVITEADEAEGTVENIARATAVHPDGDEVLSNEDDTSTTVEIPAPALTFEKTAGTPTDVNNSGITDAGDTIAYTFLVTNSGNVTINDIVIDDPLVGEVTCGSTSLLAGASTNCTAAVYVVTEEDEEAGLVENVARLTANDPDGAALEPIDDDTTTVVTAPNPVLALEKFAGDPVDVNNSGLTDAGDTIAYSFIVTNKGNVPVSAVAVNDPLAGAVTCEAATLAPSVSTNCMADELYVVTEVDEVAGKVLNIAEATGTDPDAGQVEPARDDTTTEVDLPNPELRIEKFAAAPVDVNASGITDAGDTIQYTFRVTNDGNVPVTAVSVVDPLAGAVTCAATDLLPEAFTDCVADSVYTITAKDEEANVVRNTAEATGTDPDGGEVESNTANTNTPVTIQAPVLTLDKIAGDPVDANESGRTDAGDTIAYTFTVKNDGNVPVTGVVVNDPLVGAVTCDIVDLAVGAVATCVADELYVLTQKDVNAGEFINRATAAGVDPDNEEVASNVDSTETTIARAANLVIEKNAALVDEDGDSKADVGEGINYTFTVTNTGNVTVTDVFVDDAKLAGVTCEATRLEPGDSTECAGTETYIVTQDEVDAGVVVNTATANGAAAGLDPVASIPDNTSTPVDVVLALELEKDSELLDENGNGTADAGEVIRYTFTATNSGTVSLKDLTIDDPMLMEAEVAITCASVSIAPGQSVSCTADYTVLAADVESGKPIRNVASASAMGLTGAALAPQDDTETAVTVEEDAVEDEPTEETPEVNAPAPGAGGDLPDTGGITLVAAGLGGALLLVGLMLTLVMRRRNA